MFVVLLRHAEREAGGTNPSLTAAGRARAKLLASMLAETGIDAIFTSEFKRTKETAAPIAERLGLSPLELDDDMAAAEQQLRSAGQCVLVVGHTDTVPDLISALGGPPVEIPDNAFNRLFVLHVRNDSGNLLSMTYGENL
jgi:broad specificity phosphatase PhoE